MTIYVYPHVSILNVIDIDIDVVCQMIIVQVQKSKEHSKKEILELKR